jgi:hypothetical protein
MLSSPLFAKTPPKLRDIGIIGLMSHDLFAWDRVKEVNTENGRLDLSTIFDYEGGKRWEEGGNPKNAENAPVYTITLKLVSYYKSQLKLMNAIEARKRTVVYFHKMVKVSFERLSGLPWPTEGRDDLVTNTEQAALRAMHDILPGRAKLFDGLRKSFDVTNFLNAKIKLSEKELNQEAIEFYKFELSAVVMTACIAHDIGNPPFGHSGEDAICTYFRELEGEQLKFLTENLSENQFNDFKFFE